MKGEPMKSLPTWILIADGGRAQVMEARGKGSDLALVDGMSFSAKLPPSREILSDRPGRSFESQGRTRHSIENRSDPHRALKHAFAKSLGEALQAKLADGRFARLVLVAPPPMLGVLRQALPKAVLEKVEGELALDLVKTPRDKLGAHLLDLLRFHSLG
jgi:protein required for attachment to host cells